MYIGICLIIKSPSICNFLDIDECEGDHSCHLSATCTNTVGLHECQCQCQPVYTRNGQSCTGSCSLSFKVRKFLPELVEKSYFKSYFSAGTVDDLFYTVFNHVTKPVRSRFETQNSDAFCLFLLPLDGRYINDRQQSGTKSQVWLWILELKEGVKFHNRVKQKNEDEKKN